MAFVNPLSARGGKVEVDGAPVPHVTTVSINETGDDPKYASSSTNGERLAVRGNDDCTISWTELYESGAGNGPSVSKGDIVELDVESSEGELKSGTFLIEDVSTEVPIGDAGIVAATITTGQAIAED